MTYQPARIKIRHELPNRIRFKIGNLPNGRIREYAQPLEEHEGIIWVQVNEKCASLAIGYDPDQLPRTALLNAVRQTFLPQQSGSAQSAPINGCPCSCTCASPSPDKVKKAGRRFLAISAVLGFSVFRSSVLGLTVAQTALSPLGLFALGFSLPLVRSGVKKIRQKRIDLDGFLGAGAIAAIAAGEAMTAFEILWINAGAELLTAWTAERSRRSISEILDLTSHHTFVLVDGIEVERAVEDVNIGDTVVLHTGEKISVDGVIIKGEALLNEAPITGRQEFSHKTVDDTVYSGTFVREGIIYVRAECVGDQTYLARVMHKVQEAMENRASIECTADRLAATLVKVGFGVTTLTFILTQSAWRAFTVLLVMACPCATVLAASTAISAAINAAARNHILIKGGRYLEEIGGCDTVCFDKTGTLTSHEPVLQTIVPVEGVSENDLLQLACSAETHNHHPLAQAVKAEAVQREIAPIPHTLCDYHMGMGIRAVVRGDEILVGNAKLAQRYECSLEGTSGAGRRHARQGTHRAARFPQQPAPGASRTGCARSPRSRPSHQTAAETGRTKRHPDHRRRGRFHQTSGGNAGHRPLPRLGAAGRQGRDHLRHARARAFRAHGGRRRQRRAGPDPCRRGRGHRRGRRRSRRGSRGHRPGRQRPAGSGRRVRAEPQDPAYRA